MRKILIFLPCLFFCGMAVCQIYTPITPTQYGNHLLRDKCDSVRGVPTKDTIKFTVDTFAQVFHRYNDGWWGWSYDGGFQKINGGGGSTPTLQQVIDVLGDNTVNGRLKQLSLQNLSHFEALSSSQGGSAGIEADSMQLDIYDTVGNEVLMDAGGLQINSPKQVNIDAQQGVNITYLPTSTDSGDSTIVIATNGDLKKSAPAGGQNFANTDLIQTADRYYNQRQFNTTIDSGFNFTINVKDYSGDGDGNISFNSKSLDGVYNSAVFSSPAETGILSTSTAGINASVETYGSDGTVRLSSSKHKIMIIGVDSFPSPRNILWLDNDTVRIGAIPSGGSVNTIYNHDDTVINDRTVELDGNNLNFLNGSVNIGNAGDSTGLYLDPQGTGNFEQFSNINNTTFRTMTFPNVDFTPLADVNNLSDLTSTETAKSNLNIKQTTTAGTASVAFFTNELIESITIIEPTSITVKIGTTSGGNEIINAWGVSGRATLSINYSNATGGTLYFTGLTSNSIIKIYKR